jgi:hypothetical protein
MAKIGTRCKSRLAADAACRFAKPTLAEDYLPEASV